MYKNIKNALLNLSVILLYFVIVIYLIYSASQSLYGKVKTLLIPFEVLLAFVIINRLFIFINYKEQKISAAMHTLYNTFLWGNITVSTFVFISRMPIRFSTSLFKRFENFIVLSYMFSWFQFVLISIIYLMIIFYILIAKKNLSLKHLFHYLLLSLLALINWLI